MNSQQQLKISLKIFLQKAKTIFKEQYLNETTFYIFRTDTNQVLARNVDSYDSAKEMANQIRKRLGLKWSVINFKAERQKISTDRPERQDFGKGIVKQPGHGKYAGTTSYASGVRTHFKDWDE